MRGHMMRGLRLVVPLLACPLAACAQTPPVNPASTRPVAVERDPDALPTWAHAKVTTMPDTTVPQKVVAPIAFSLTLSGGLDFQWVFTLDRQDRVRCGWFGNDTNGQRAPEPRVATFDLTPAEVAGLCAALNAADVTRLADEYDAHVADGTVVTVDIAGDGYVKRVVANNTFPGQVCAVFRCVRTLARAHGAALSAAHEVSINEMAAATSLPALAAPKLPPPGPGSFHRDSRGFPRGTGWTTYGYGESGPVKLKEAYVDGQLVWSEWYRPDGTTVARTQWVDGNGVGFYLYDDGTIKAKMPYRHGVAEGKATFYRPDGSVDRNVEYHQGKPVTP